ncbi:MAG TPA: MFS transporter [Candidatus Saccharimonadia bacterium]|nr:MFS transporter [Candidatus Saccharimonadia bacterium]
MPDAERSGEEPRASALSPFRHTVYRQVWLAGLFSNLGGMIQSVGAAWTMVALGQPAHIVALVQASVSLPVMLLSLVAGAVADNVDRRKVMLAAQASMLLVSIALAACAWSGVLTPWLLLLFTFLIGCASAFNTPAWQASVGDMVPRAELPSAVALNSVGFNIARSVGPAIGGAIVATAGAAAAFALNAVSYLGLVAVLARWRPVVHPQPLPRERLGQAIASGIRYVSMSPAIRRVLLRSAFFGVGASAVISMMPLIASRLIGGGPVTYGLLLGAFGVGAVAGAAGTARLRDAFSTESLVRIGCVGFAVTASIAGISSRLPATMLVLLLGGAAWVMTLSTLNVAVQLSTPRWVVARALSLYQMAAFGGLAGGSWLWGVVATKEGIGTALLGGAAVLVACALFGLRAPLAQSAALDLDPLREWREPATAVPVEPRTGPVVVTIEYVIREEDVLDFLAAMAERRRIRLRDGAHDWSLLRDLADPRIWIEEYRTPTWLEYVRHTNRITRDDATVPARLRALHQGPEPPRVRRMIERQTSAPPGGAPPGPRELAEPMTDPNRSS